MSDDRELVDMQLAACTRTMREVADVLKNLAERLSWCDDATSRNIGSEVFDEAEKLMRVRAEKVPPPLSSER